MTKSSSSSMLSQQAAEPIESSTSPQPSSLKCKYSNSSKSEPPELFNWNREQVRHNSEYIDNEFSKPFNIIAPELRIIGGLGPIKCLNKKKGHPKHVNRPTQVQKISHTTTKVLPNFNFTEQLKPIICERPKHMSVDEHVKKVKIAENLPISDESSVVRRMKSFKHENPFNLDLNALSEYQKQKSHAEDAQRRRKSQIVRRTMETFKLKTEGTERIKQEERDEKFGLPAFFRISHDDDNDETMDVETELPKSPSASSKYKCGLISMLDKPKNKEIVELHYKHKEDKLRQRIRMTKLKEEALAKEIEEREKEAKENQIFRLADESFPPSEHHSTASEDASIDKIKFDYRESGRLSQSCQELVEKAMDAISCGQKIGKSVILRGFHDRMFSEPRGKSNLYRMEHTTNDSCRTHKEWLQTITNDPKIVNSPPKGRILSSIKGACDPSDDKTFLFNDKNESNKMMMTMIKKSNVMKNIKSPIKQHIKEIDKKLKQKYLPRMKKSLKSQIEMNEIQKRYQRMKFMGIPTMAMNELEQMNDNERIWRENQETFSTHDGKMKGTKNNNDDELTSKDKHSNTTTTPEAIKLIPKIPSSSCSDNTEDEFEQSKVVGFTKAHPRGNNPEMLQIDKSLPWIHNEINLAKVKFQIDYDEKNRKSYNVAIDNWNHVSIDCDETKKKQRRIDDKNQSEIRMNFNNIIASKREHYIKSIGIELNDEEDDNAHATVDKDYDTKSMQSASTLSSTGTYFTNDSGSHVVILDEEIPKSRVNIAKKFQNHSLVTTKSQPSFDSQPYFITDLHTMKKLHKPPDRFHTQRTRSCANIRERVKVDSLDYGDELIGNEKVKMKSLLATDIDESYVKELYNERSRTEFRFKRISEVEKMREGFMKKIEAYYMKEQMMVNKVQAVNDAKIMKEVTETVNQYDKFLNEHKETVNHKTMKLMHDVKQYYVDTDKLRGEYDVVRVQVGPIKMKIFYIGNDFMRVRRYQDFQFLLMPLSWRLKHDHLHLDYGDESLKKPILEDMSKSILNRGMKNAWDQANVSVENIMQYINNVYCINEPKKVFPFKNGKEMSEAIEFLKSKSIKILSKFLYVAIASNKVDDDLKKLNSFNDKIIGDMKFKAEMLRDRTKFLKQRTVKLLSKLKELTQEPLEESFKDPLYHELTGICRVQFKTIILGYKIDEKNSMDDAKIFSSVDQFRWLEEKVLKMFASIDEMPQDLFNEIEQKVRMERKRKIRMAEHACKIEDNINTTMKQLQRLFADPPKREKIIGKLKRLYLKKKPQRIKKSSPLFGPLEEEYLKAFMEVSDEKDISEAKFDPNVKLMIEKIKNESTPFYVDRFIESLGIQMKKLDPHDVDEIIEDETARMKFKDVLPGIRIKMNKWEDKMNFEKEKNIMKTYFLYEKKNK